jgi:hypothetical protein
MQTPEVVVGLSLPVPAQKPHTKTVVKPNRPRRPYEEGFACGEDTHKETSGQPMTNFVESTKARPAKSFLGRLLKSCADGLQEDRNPEKEPAYQELLLEEKQLLTGKGKNRGGSKRNREMKNNPEDPQRSTAAAHDLRAKKSRRDHPRNIGSVRHKCRNQIERARDTASGENRKQIGSPRS